MSLRPLRALTMADRADGPGDSVSPLEDGGVAVASPELAAKKGWRWWLTRFARPALFIYWPVLFYLTHGVESASVNKVFKQIQQVHPDKWAHFFAYTVLTLLMVFAQLAGRSARFTTNLAVGCALASLYAVADELTQAIGPFDRTPDGADITADLWAVAAVYVALLVTHPDRRKLPAYVLIARIIVALVIPMSGVMLFVPNNPMLQIDIWRIVPPFMGYIRGDHVAHFLGALLLTPLIALAAPLGASPGKARANALLAIIGVEASGPVIEWIQGAFFKRGAEWEDFAAHTWGVLTAVVLWGAWLSVRLYVRRGMVSVIATDVDTDLDDTPVAPPLPLRERAGVRVEADEEVAASEPDNARANVIANELVDAHPHPASQTRPPSPSEGEGAKQHRFIGHAIVVGIMTLVSRFTGLVRDAVLAGALGLSATADAFSIGFLVPNLFRRLFGEGALTAAFIPIYSGLVQKDKVTARRLASMCIAVMLVFLGGLTLIGELVLLAVTHAKSWSTETSLAIELTMIMLPYMPMICIVALIGGILQVHGRFAAPAAAPIFLNIVMIIGTVAAVKVSGEDVTRAVRLVSWTVLIAGLVQLLWQVAMVLRFEQFTTVFAGAGTAFKQMLVMMVPMFIGLGVFQINTLCDYLIAFALSSKEGGPEHLHILGLTLEHPVNTGDVAALNWAQRLYQFPLGVFGLAVATAIFPALARAAAEGEESGNSSGSGQTKSDASTLDQKSEIRNEKSGIASSSFQSILHQGLRLTFFIGLPASLGLILLRVPITRLIYERGEFGLAESQRVAFVMIGYCSVIWAYSMTHVLTRTFYAVKDSKTPLKISMWMVLLNFILNLVLVWPLGVAGMAWASATSSVAQVIWMTVALKKHVAQPVSRAVVDGWKTTILLTVLMTAVLLPVTLIYDAAQMTRVKSALQLAVLLPLGAAIVLGGAWMLKMPELIWLRRRRRR